MKSILAALALLICCVNPSWAASGWVTVATTTEGGHWEAKSGSLEFSKTRGGTPIAVVIGRVTYAYGDTVSLYKWYVPLKDCMSGNGTVVSLNMSGDYEFQNDFVLDGGNVASAMASAICGAAIQAVKNAEKKSM